jgi:hypothetical protein
MNLFERLKHRETTLRRVLNRRWYVVAAVILCMLPAFYLATTSTGVYYSRAQLLFLPPSNKVGGNALQSEAVTTVMYAAIVERRFNGNEGEQPLRTTDAPLYSTGLRNGYSVFLPNSGGQWQMSFQNPEIVIEVVAGDADTAASEMKRIAGRLRQLASEQQKSIGVYPEAYITTELSPAQPDVMYVGIRKSREMAAVAGLTGALALGVPLLSDRLLTGLSQRRARQKKSNVPGPPEEESVHALVVDVPGTPERENTAPV